MEQPPFLDALKTAYTYYSFVVLALIATVVSYSLVIEREFFRRIVPLLLLVNMSAPSGGDYKLLYAEVALVVFILLPTRRPHDLIVAVLLALIMIPKREILLTALATSEGGNNDVSIAILLNPIFMLVVLALIMHDGFAIGTWQERRQRFFRLLRPLNRFGINQTSQGWLR